MSVRASQFDEDEDWRLRHVAELFSGERELPWMMASAAIIQVYRGMSVRVDAVLGDFDLNTFRYEVLGLLDRSPNGRMSARDLKKATLLHPPTMTYTLDWLEERKYISRKPHATDRRSIDIAIHKSGRELFASATAALAEIQFGLVGVDRAGAEEIAQVLIKHATASAKTD